MALTPSESLQHHRPLPDRESPRHAGAALRRRSTQLTARHRCHRHRAPAAERPGARPITIAAETTQSRKQIRWWSRHSKAIAARNVRRLWQPTGCHAGEGDRGHLQAPLTTRDTVSWATPPASPSSAGPAPRTPIAPSTGPSSATPCRGTTAPAHPWSCTTWGPSPCCRVEARRRCPGVRAGREAFPLCLVTTTRYEHPVDGRPLCPRLRRRPSWRTSPPRALRRSGRACSAPRTVAGLRRRPARTPPWSSDPAPCLRVAEKDLQSPQRWRAVRDVPPGSSMHQDHCLISA